MTHQSHGTRCAALVGAQGSGKSMLLESLLHAAGAIDRRGSVKDRTSVADSAPEARARMMSTEITPAPCRYLDENWVLLDCPGSVELQAEARAAMLVSDIAIVVAEPVPERAVALSPVLRFLDDHRIPHLLFINKTDQPEAHVRATFQALQAVSDRPLVLRELPMRDEAGHLTGMVDLLSERAWAWDPHAPAREVPLPDRLLAEESAARGTLLETLADFDDHIMEQLLEDVTPAGEEVRAALARDVAGDLVVPVLFGSAENENGIRRLWKALRHEGPDPAATAARRGLAGAKGALAEVIRCFHPGQSGRAALARVWSGEVRDAMTLGGERVGGLGAIFGRKITPRGPAGLGDVVVLGRMNEARTGELLDETGRRPAPWPAPQPPLYALSIRAEKPAEEARLAAALARLVDEDAGLSTRYRPETGETLLEGQGDIHLQIALARLKGDHGLALKVNRPAVAYRETITTPTTFHARHKKQSGGHGEFADIHVEIRPEARGAGFSFAERITGGVVPRQYIPAVEKGVQTALDRGPLGFPVVDLSVTLFDGSAHSVDSSDFAFQKAGAKAMAEALPDCGPVLLEPVQKVTISVPSDFTPRAQRIVTGRRSQILGFDAKPGWRGWDEVSALMPESETADLIIDLRSQTQGAGFFEASFDHMQPLAGREADQVVAARAQALKG